MKRKRPFRGICLSDEKYHFIKRPRLEDAWRVIGPEWRETAVPTIKKVPIKLIDMGSKMHTNTCEWREQAAKCKCRTWRWDLWPNDQMCPSRGRSWLPMIVERDLSCCSEEPIPPGRFYPLHFSGLTLLVESYSGMCRDVSQLVAEFARSSDEPMEATSVVRPRVVCFRCKIRLETRDWKQSKRLVPFSRECIFRYAFKCNLLMGTSHKPEPYLAQPLQESTNIAHFKDLDFGIVCVVHHTLAYHVSVELIVRDYRQFLQHRFPSLSDFEMLQHGPIRALWG